MGLLVTSIPRTIRYYRLLCFLILTAFSFVHVAFAGVELGQSTITAEAETVPAGTTVKVNVVLKNTGDKPSDGTDVRIRFPRNGFLVQIDELPGLKRDDNEREVTARLDIPAGDESRFSFVLLASRSEAQQRLSSDIEVRNFLADARLDSEFSIKITNAPSNAGIVVGGFRFHPAAGWLLGWLLCSAWMFISIRTRLRWIREHSQFHVVSADVRRIPSFAIVSLVMIPLAFLMVLGGMAWRDLQTLTSWNESQATILDRREDVQSGRADRHRNGRRRTTGSTSTPEFALKYQAVDREVISSGFATGPTLHIGGQILGKAKMEEWVPGKTIPCWYDPSDPRIVVVQRGFGAQYLIFGPLFGLLPLAILWFGVQQLRKVSNAVRQLHESEMEGYTA